MTDAELRSAFEQLDAMSERVDRVIGRERDPKPLRPDVSYPRTRRARPVHKSPLQSPAVASGPLAGNEMRVWSGYTAQPRSSDDDDPTGMWVAFESDFDDMVKGMH